MLWKHIREIENSHRKHDLVNSAKTLQKMMIGRNLRYITKCKNNENHAQLCLGDWSAIDIKEDYHNFVSKE